MRLIEIARPLSISNPDPGLSASSEGAKANTSTQSSPTQKENSKVKSLHPASAHDRGKLFINLVLVNYICTACM